MNGNHICSTPARIWAPSAQAVLGCMDAVIGHLIAATPRTWSGCKGSCPWSSGLRLWLPRSASRKGWSGAPILSFWSLVSKFNNVTVSGLVEKKRWLWRQRVAGDNPLPGGCEERRRDATGLGLRRAEPLSASNRLTPHRYRRRPDHIQDFNRLLLCLFPPFTISSLTRIIPSVFCASNYLRY